MKRALIAALAVAMTSTMEVKAQSELPEWTFDAKAGFNIGGTSPLPIPAEIREIRSFNPGMQLTFGLNATRWLTDRWGVGAGLKFENKGMETEARVKNYYMEVVDGDAKISGNWTGLDYTNCQQQFFTVPIVSRWRLGKRVDLNAGIQLGVQIKGEFSGYVSEGYLRENDPTGNKIIFSGDATATYSFGDHLNKFMFGLQAGGNVKLWRNVGLFGDLSWGLRDAFEKDFKTVAFAMYPIYFNIGLSYSM